MNTSSRALSAKEISMVPPAPIQPLHGTALCDNAGPHSKQISKPGPFRVQRWGPVGEGAAHSCPPQMPDIDAGEGFVGGRWELGCAQLEAARNLTLADGD